MFFCKIFYIIVFKFLLLTNIHSQHDLAKIIPVYEKYVEKSYQEWMAPGIAIAIIKDGKIIYEKGFGVTDINSKKSVNAHSVFHVASLTKTFLSSLFAQLVDEGKLKFDDPVRKYWPDFFIESEETSQSVTVRDLISHRIGLPAFSGDTFVHLNFSQKEIIEGLGKIKLKYPIRTHYGYQNHIFGMASNLAEKVTGKEVGQLFSEKFFIPLGMKDSSVGMDAMNPKKNWWQKLKSLFVKDDESNITKPHDILDGKPHIMPVHAGTYSFMGSTGINSSIHDMAQWVLFHLNNAKIDGKRIISEKILQELKSPQIEVIVNNDKLQFPKERFSNIHYGMGWFLFDYGTSSQTVKMIGHMSGLSGSRGLIAMVPSENLGLVILSNLGSMRVSMLPESLREKFFDLYFGWDTHDWSMVKKNYMKEVKDSNHQFKVDQKNLVPMPSGKLEKYVGKYKSDLYGAIDVSVENDKLCFTIRGRKVPVTHWNADEFSFKGADLSSYYGDAEDGCIEFITNNSKITSCVINLLMEGDGIFTRIQ